MKKNILLYGAGFNCQVFLRYAYKDNINIIAIIDKNKYGYTLDAINILHPDSIVDLDFDEILVTPEENTDIIEMLVNKYFIPINKIKLPENINNDYIIIPRIELNHTIIFGKENEESCFYFVFKKIINENKAIYINFTQLLRCKNTLVNNFISNKTKLFLFFSFDVVKLKNNGFLSYLNLVYPNAKKFLWICDPVSDPLYGVPQLIDTYGDVENLKKEFDYCYTYNSGDAKKYNLIFYPQFFPNVKIHKYINDIEYDVFFIGYTKKRNQLIYNIYNKLSAAGLKCRFLLLGIPTVERNIKGIIYIDKLLGYSDVLKEVGKSKCILEVCNNDNETSLRYAEAIILNKKLLVNDYKVKKRKYYNKNNIQIYHSADDIDINWFYKETQNYDYSGDFDTEFFFKEVLHIM